MAKKKTTKKKLSKKEIKRRIATNKGAWLKRSRFEPEEL